MTEQDKDILVEKMLNSPSSLTDEELSRILNDDELKDLYGISSAVKGAYMSRLDVEVDDEWRVFRQRIMPAPSPMRCMMRVAAIFLGVMLLSGILVKFIDYYLADENEPIIVSDAGKHVDMNYPLSNGINGHPMADGEIISAVHPVVEGSQNATSVKTGRSLSTPEKVKPEEEEIDVDEYLRRQQSEIDYEIALLNAEMLLDEQDAMREFIGYINGENMREAETDIIIQ